MSGVALSYLRSQMHALLLQSGCPVTVGSIAYGLRSNSTFRRASEQRLPWSAKPSVSQSTQDDVVWSSKELVSFENGASSLFSPGQFIRPLFESSLEG
jgi:hypothetical protein